MQKDWTIDQVVDAKKYLILKNLSLARFAIILL